jgi:hypothetical protein
MFLGRILGGSFEDPALLNSLTPAAAELLQAAFGVDWLLLSLRADIWQLLESKCMTITLILVVLARMEVAAV